MLAIQLLNPEFPRTRGREVIGLLSKDSYQSLPRPCDSCSACE